VHRKREGARVSSPGMGDVAFATRLKAAPEFTATALCQFQKISPSTP